MWRWCRCVMHGRHDRLAHHLAWLFWWVSGCTACWPSHCGAVCMLLELLAVPTQHGIHMGVNDQATAFTRLHIMVQALDELESELRDANEVAYHPGAAPTVSWGGA